MLYVSIYKLTCHYSALLLSQVSLNHKTFNSYSIDYKSSSK